MRKLAEYEGRNAISAVFKVNNEYTVQACGMGFGTMTLYTGVSLPEAQRVAQAWVK